MVKLVKIWISNKWRNTTIWSKKIDRTSYIYLFSFTKRFRKARKKTSSNSWSNKSLKSKKKALKSLKLEKNQELQSIKELFPKTIGTNEIKNDIDEFRKWHEKIKHKILKI